MEVETGNLLMAGMGDLPKEDDAVVDAFTRTSGNLADEGENINPSRYDAYHGFDPDIHVTDVDGNPVKNKDGTWRKKRGRKVSDPTRQESRELAVVTVETMERVAVLAISPEWVMMKDEGIDEKAGLVTAFDRFYDAHDIDDIPPGVALAIACGSYVIPRLAMEQTKKKFGGLTGKVRLWWHNRKKRKLEEQVSQFTQGEK